MQGAHEQGEPRSRHLGRGHMPALDGVRGLAFLGIFLTHYVTGNLTGGGPAVRLFFEFCTGGVDLFFVLSGFLITGILRDSLADEGYFRKFYARRALRIFPLYYGVLILLMLGTRLLQIHWAGVLPSLLLYLQNTPVMPSLLNFPPQRFVQLDHLWSLAVEEQFYLVWPFLVFLVRPSRLLLVCCASGMVGAAALRFFLLTHGSGYEVINRGTLTRCDELLLGAALVVLLRSSGGGELLRWAPWTLAVFTACFATWPFAVRSIVRPGQAFATIMAGRYIWFGLLCASLLAWSLADKSIASAVFQHRALRWVGKYSYGLYVLHVVPLPFYNSLLHPLRQWTGHAWMARVAVAILAFVCSAVLAYLSFQVYEKRFLRLKRYFDYGPRPGPEAQVMRS